MPKHTPRTARETALQVLTGCLRRGAWSDSALSSAIRAAGLDGRDAALASRICYGVQQNQALLDYWLGQMCSVPVEKLEVPVRCAMELGMYQIAFLERVPDRAAVNESVELARANSRNPNSPRLVNAVLRGFARQKDSLPRPESLAVRYSHPDWLVELYRQELDGEGLEALLQANNAQPPTVIHTNPLKTTPEALSARLTEEGVQVQPNPFFADSFYLTGSGDLEQLGSFRDGWFQIQDTAARFAVEAADPKPGMRVLDVCAAPGGKSFRMAQRMENRGSILACDVQEKKLGRIRQGADRLGISILRTEAMDGRVFRPEMAGQFDVVLTDVPCSGLGIIRKKPDIRYKDPAPLERLPEIQGAILSASRGYVKPGGVLLYATCTVLRRENQAVVERFLEEHPEFHPEPFTLPVLGEYPGMVTLWPHIHETDGFFVAKLRKQDD